MRFIVLLSAISFFGCSEPVAGNIGFSGPGEPCDVTRVCSEGLNCRGGLCTASRGDSGTALDAGSEDGGEALDATALPVADAGLSHNVALTLTRPGRRSSIEAGQRVEAVVELRGDNLSDYRLRWSSDLAGEIGFDEVPVTGRVLRSISLEQNGIHRLLVELLWQDEVLASDEVLVGVCGWEVLADFQGEMPGWRLYGDASRDQRGWLELTGNQRTRKGAIYQVSHRIEPGDVRLAFRISTGHCDEPGPCSFDQAHAADGFAMNIWDVANEQELASLFERAQTGAGMGYGVAGAYGDFTGDAFHVEFDTWYNNSDGNGSHTDPTQQNHVGVTLDGDPGHSVAFAAVEHLEDNEWHDVELIIDGDHLRVKLDALWVIDERVAGLDFKGGYIGFSGTTGYYTNFHRFDDLRSRRLCDP